MTISPAQAEARAIELARLYAEAELEIIRLIGRRLEDGIDAPHWAGQKLADLGRLRREIEADLTRLADAGYQQLALAIEDAFETGVNGALADLRGAGIEGAFGRTNVAAAQALIDEAALGLRGTHLGILRQAEDAYRQVVAEASRLAVAGAETRRQAAQRVLDEFARRGISGFVDSAGRRWEAATYAEMTTRTALGRAAVQGHIDTLVANGRDLVIVSDSPEECPLCRPWEGKVLSISGGTRGWFSAGDGATVTVAGTVGEARAAGLFHPSCTHRLGLFVPGLTTRMRDTPNPEGFAERQRQRYLERNIRQWKRREAAAMTDEGRAYARRHREAWQARMREFIAETERRRNDARESTTSAR